MQEALEKGEKLDLLAGKMMATLFYEPSTRTRFSFEAAMGRLGGKVLSNADMLKTSSAKKSETLWDTGKVVSQMADVIAMRHPEKGAVAQLAEGSDVPVLNAGDGPGDHPTQALLDMYSIWKYKGGLDGLTVGIIDELDVIAINRIQEERFESQQQADSYRGKFVLSKELMGQAKEDAIVLCPLPRLEELPKEIDEDPRAKYFEQVGNGVAARMALLLHVLGVK